MRCHEASKSCIFRPRDTSPRFRITCQHLQFWFCLLLVSLRLRLRLLQLTSPLLPMNRRFSSIERSRIAHLVSQLGTTHRPAQVVAPFERVAHSHSLPGLVQNLIAS